MGDAINWFISVIVVGVIVGLLSSYLKPPIDRVLSFFFISYRNRQMKKFEKMRDQANRISESPSLMVDYQFDVLWTLVHGIGWLLSCSVSAMLMGVYAILISINKPAPDDVSAVVPLILSGLIALICLFFGITTSSESNKLNNIVRYARILKSMK